MSMTGSSDVDWTAPLSDPEPFDASSGTWRLGQGWSPWRVAQDYLVEGRFGSELVLWLLAVGRQPDEVGRFARDCGVETGDFVRSYQQLDGTPKVTLIKGFLGGEPFRPCPSKGAHPEEVAAYLDDLESEVGPRSYDDEEERRRFRRLCEQHGWSWSHVSRALRQRRTAAIATHSGKGLVVVTEAGIRVYLDRFPEPRPLCPFKRKTYDIDHGCVSVVERDCSSQSCVRCGKRVADHRLRQVETRIRALPTAYVAQCPWDSNLTTRMRRRRADHQSPSPTYRSTGSPPSLRTGPSMARPRHSSSVP